jgi:hypothetical protein
MNLTRQSQYPKQEFEQKPRSTQRMTCFSASGGNTIAPSRSLRLLFKFISSPIPKQSATDLNGKKLIVALRSVGAGIVLMSMMIGQPTRAANSPVSLIRNGDFEISDKKIPTKPSSWFQPDGLGVQWTNDPDSKAHGKCIRMDTSVSEKAMVTRWQQIGLTNFWDVPKPTGGAIAESYGLSYYSDAIQVKPSQAYRITFDFKGKGGGKVWVRCYGLYEGEMRRRYEKIVMCEGSGNDWTTQSAVFHPTRERPQVSEMKVMLYAYYPPGLYWFDNIRIVSISPEEYTSAKKAASR